MLPEFPENRQLDRVHSMAAKEVSGLHSIFLIHGTIISYSCLPLCYPAYLNENHVNKEIAVIRWHNIAEKIWATMQLP